jgi:hypothetical protein
MREIRTSGSMRGIVETESMVQLLRHRQTKEAATDMLDLPALRHIPTLPLASGEQERRMIVKRAETFRSDPEGSTPSRQRPASQPEASLARVQQ